MPAVLLLAAQPQFTPRDGARWSVPPAAAAEPWKEEFDKVCARTQESMSLSVDELRTLVRRCDDLKPRIDGLEETERKVFAKRLKMCRDLYQYVLDAKNRETAGTPP